MITRNYTHRTFGNIGSVEFGVPKGKFTLNGTELPDASVAHLMTFALQTLQDAYAGAKTADEATGAFNTKLDRLLTGTIGTRGSGSGVDEVTIVQRSVTKAAAKANMGAKSPEWAEFTGLSDDDQNAKLDEWFAQHADALTDAVDAELESRRQKRERKAGLKGKVAFAL
jgi:hypothetical protein